METEYKHVITVVVSEGYMTEANEVALVAGESFNDRNTFVETDWQDEEGNLYSISSTVVKPIVLDMLSSDISELELDFKDADLDIAREVMSNIVLYEKGMVANKDKVIIGVDFNPLKMIADLGIRIADEPVRETEEEQEI